MDLICFFRTILPGSEERIALPYICVCNPYSIKQRNRNTARAETTRMRPVLLSELQTVQRNWLSQKSPTVFRNCQPSPFAGKDKLRRIILIFLIPLPPIGKHSHVGAPGDRWRVELFRTHTDAPESELSVFRSPLQGKLGKNRRANGRRRGCSRVGKCNSRTTTTTSALAPTRITGAFTP